MLKILLNCNKPTNRFQTEKVLLAGF